MPHSLALLAGVAVCIAAGDYTSKSQSSHSHWLSWAVIAAASKGYIALQGSNNVYQSKRETSSTSHRVNEVSFAVASYVICQSIADVKWLIPLLACASSAVLNYDRDEEAQSESTSSSGWQWVWENLAPYAGIAFVACLLLLPPHFDFKLFLISVWAFLSLTAIFVILGRSTAWEDNGMQQPIDRLSRIAVRTVLLLVLYSLTNSFASEFPSEPMSLVTLSSVALVEALSWGALLLVLQTSNASLSASLYTYSILTVRAFQGQDMWSTFAPVAASGALLLHLRVLFARTSVYRTFFLAFAAIPCLAVVSWVFNANKDLPVVSWSSGALSASQVSSSQHPIELLAAESQDRFEQMLSKQSKTVREAASEYQRRYNRKPPPGFDQWFMLCQEHGVKFVDEYDSLMASLEPLWGVSPAELRARTTEALDGVSGMDKMIISDGVIDTGWWPVEMQAYVSMGAHFLPDMKIAINTLDEPRVVVPNDMLQYLNSRPQLPESWSIKPKYNLPKFIDIRHQKTWDYATHSCDMKSPSRSSRWGDYMEQGLLFVTNASANTDLCSHPELEQQHGLFYSPESFWLTTSMVPIFSQGRPTTFSDILYPSPYYVPTLNDYKAENDVPYAEKGNKLYWAGGTTGGQISPSTWRKILRTRFAALVADKDKSHKVLLLTDRAAVPSTTSQDAARKPVADWKFYRDTMSTMKDLFHVSITSIVQCNDEGTSDWCSPESLDQYFDVGDGESFDEALKYKLLMDLDGNGFSGRYYRLLKSNSCVLKSTLYREWHDDYLIPWVHYVPISIGLEELGETVRFLTTDPRGHAVGERIAKQGQAWANAVLRKEDMGLVMVRILMEMGRLLDDRRDKLAYGG